MTLSIKVNYHLVLEMYVGESTPSSVSLLASKQH